MASEAIESRLRSAEQRLLALQQRFLGIQDETSRLAQDLGKIRSELESATPHSVPPSPPKASTAGKATPPPLPPRAAPPATKKDLVEEELPVAEIVLEDHADSIESPRTMDPAAASHPIGPPPIRKPLAKDLDSEGLELKLGRIWFVRIGIGLLVTAFVFFSTYAYQNFIVYWAPLHRIGALYLAATLLTAAGIVLERWRESLRNYGRVVAAGGFAAIYYTTYAAHHVAHLRVIESPLLTATLLTLVSLAFFAYAARRRSSTLAVGALVLAFYATAINPVGWVGCFSGLLLSAIGAFFSLRYRWLQTGLASLLGAYLSYTYWQVFINPDAIMEPTRWFLVGYWLVFTSAALAPQARALPERHLLPFTSANNALFFVLFSFEFHSLRWVDHLWINALAFGAVLLALALLLGLRSDRPRLLVGVLLGKGLALVTWGLTLQLTGPALFLSLTFEAVVLAAAWRRYRLPVVRAFVWIAAGLGGILAIDHLSFAAEPPLTAFLIEGALFLALALLMRGAPWFDEDSRLFSAEGSAASAGALLIPIAALIPEISSGQLGLVMAAGGVILWLAFLALSHRWPLPELAWLSQGLGALGFLVALSSSLTPGQGILLIGLGALAVYGQARFVDRKAPSPFPTAHLVFETAFTAAMLGALGLLIGREVDDPSLLLLCFTLLPAAGHLLGSSLRRTPLVLQSQAFYLVTLLQSTVAWSGLPTVGAASLDTALIALGIVATHFVIASMIKSLRFRDLLREGLLTLTLLLWTGWSVATFEAWWLVLAWTAFLAVLMPERFQCRMLAPGILTLLTFALGGLALLETTSFPLRYAALLGILLTDLALRKKVGTPRVHPAVLTGLSLAVLASLTLVASEHTLELFDGKGLSVCWALVALTSFGLGLLARVRSYRLGGLGVLALALGHVLSVDVWNLDTLPRIISFFSLGLALLALGFIYNRWHEQIRKFL